MTLILPGSERFVDALVAKLEDGLPPVIAELNARDTKGIVLDDATVLDYIPSDSELNAFPCAAVRDGAEALQDDVGWGATGVMELIVVSFALAPDQRTLAWQLRRLLQAVKTVALEGRNLNVDGDPTSAWGMTYGGTQPGPTLGRTEGPREWMSYSATSFRVMGEDFAT